MHAYGPGLAPARPQAFTAGGLIVSGACFLKGVSLVNVDATNPATVIVSDGISAASAIFVTALQAAAGLAPAPCWFGDGGILLERGCFVQVTGTGFFSAAVWVVPAVRALSLESEYVPDVFAQQVQ